MPYTQTMMPMFRDASADGLIGICGCMRYFQDIHTWFMHSLGKGNDTLPEEYGVAWVYTRYQVKVMRKMDYAGPATVSAWIEPSKKPARVIVNTSVSQVGALTAVGRLESCIFSLERRRPLRLQAVDFPEGLAEDIPHDIAEFRKLEKSTDGMEARYQRTVRYSDLDKSQHMTNLRYIEMFQDAHDAAFWNELDPTEMEICFLSQCMEGETLTVLSRMEEGAVHLAAAHEDGSLASVAVFVR